MTMISAEISAYLIGREIRDSKVRVLFFLLSHTGPVTTADISQAVGVTPKAVNRAIKRLAGAGIIQPGEPEPRTRTFNIPGVDREGPQGGSEEDRPNPSFVDRLDRIEAALGRLMDSKGTGTDSKGAEPDASGTRRDTEDTGTGAGEATIDPVKAPVGDHVGQQGDQPITCAPASNISLLASSLKKANSSSLQEFKDLFGMPVPDDFEDHAAVAEMVRRKKAGKLADIKNPVGYLRSLAGKVPVSPDQPGGKPAKASHVPPALAPKKVAIENALREKWFSLTDTDREPYRMRARNIQSAGGQAFKVPIELLARAQFNREQMVACGG